MIFTHSPVYFLNPFDVGSEEWVEQVDQGAVVNSFVGIILEHEPEQIYEFLRVLFLHLYEQFIELCLFDFDIVSVDDVGVNVRLGEAHF